jgi:DNA primase
MIDFAVIKEQFNFEAVIKKLGLVLIQNGTQWRGRCPHCKTGDERSLVITEGKGFYCFTAKAGGDQLALVAHIKEIPVKQAAEWLAEKAPGKLTGFQLDYLEPEHEAVVAVGFSTEFAKKHGIGYAPKGILKGTVAVPFRDEHGTCLGYVGITDATLPKDFQ